MIVSGTNADKVFEFFELLSSVPHGSGNMGAICDICERFASERGLFCLRDECGNIIIKKEGSAGYEQSEPVILQGHLDMVCAKDSDCKLDMANEPIILCRDGDYLRAEGTSLGGDNIIAVAMIMALLDSDDIPHPPIEAVFTVDEEIGLLGASVLDTSVLSGKRMLNLDSEEEGVFTVCCAGGVRVNATLPHDKYPTTTTEVAYIISVDGLSGGHSGVDIIRGRESANRLIIRFLSSLSRRIPTRLASLCGGELDNVICPKAEAVVVIDPADAEALHASVLEFDRIYKNELAVSDGGVSVTALAVELPTLATTASDSRRILALLFSLPNHIQRMSRDFEGLVQTSLNMGVLMDGDDALRFSYSVRSSISSEKEELVEKIRVIVEELGGGSIALHGEYPAWEYKRTSPLCDLLKQTYLELTGKSAKIEGTHGGLECGVFSGSIEGLDCVSLGPDLFDVHSPREKLSIPSVGRLWTLVCTLLEKMK